MQLSDLLARPCAADHFGVWQIEPQWFAAACSAVRGGQWQASQSRNLPMSQASDSGKTLPKSVYHGEDAEGRPKLLYMVGEDGIAPISIHGHMTKGESSLGGTSTVRSRMAMRAAYADPDVKGILLHIDSPGGTAAGTPQLADDIHRLARDGRKPIHAHAEDLMASAAYYVGSQASRVTVNATGEVGSIGTVALIEDSSGAAEKAGFKMHVISTGPFKGSFAPGVEVTDSQLNYARERVEAVTEPFLQAIKRGRNMAIADARQLAYGDEGGKVWSASRSLELGLVDAIESEDAAIANLRQAIRQNEAAREAQSTDRRRRIRLAEMS